VNQENPVISFFACFRDKSIAFLFGEWTDADEVRFGILNFGYWNLFEICDLEIVILIGSALLKDLSKSKWSLRQRCGSAELLLTVSSKFFC